MFSQLTQTFTGSLSSHRQLLLDIVGLATRRLPVRPQSTGADVLLVAPLTHVRPVVRMEALVQLQMHELRELLGAEITRVRFLAAVQPEVRLQVRC